MASVFRFPHQAVRLGIQEHSRSLFCIRHFLCHSSVVCNDMDKLHIRNFRRDPVGVTDIIQGFDPLLFHLIFYKKSLVDNPEILVDISPFQLIPCKNFHLITVMCIDLTALVFICDQICIQECTFMIIQGISMHKIQIDRSWQLLVELCRFCRCHIIFIKLCNLQFRLHCLFIPFEILLFRTAPFDQKCTDGSQDH